MSTRYHQHKERLESLADLGRELTRRSKAKCELCGTGGERLQAVEVEPLPDQPDADHTIFLCDQCRYGVEGERLDPERWHFLQSVVWSDIPPVQITAVRMCRRLSEEGVNWATDILAELYLSPEIEARL
jgi:protein PhnA